MILVNLLSLPFSFRIQQMCFGTNQLCVWGPRNVRFCLSSPMLLTTNSDRSDNHLPVLVYPLNSPHLLGNLFIWSCSFYSSLVPLMIYNLYDFSGCCQSECWLWPAICYSELEVPYVLFWWDLSVWVFLMSDIFFKFGREKMINYCLNTFSLCLLHMFLKFCYDRRN